MNEENVEEKYVYSYEEKYSTNAFYYYDRNYESEKYSTSTACSSKKVRFLLLQTIRKFAFH